MDDKDRREAAARFEKAEAARFAANLSGENGAKAQLGAVRELARKEAEDVRDGMSFQSADGSAIQGGQLGMFSINAPDDPTRFRDHSEGGGASGDDGSGRRFWRVVNITDTTADPIVPEVFVDPNGATVRPNIGFRNALAIAGIDDPITLAAGSIGYLKLVETTSLVCTMTFDAAWTNDEPFKVTSDVPDWNEFYYPIFQCTAYDADLAEVAWLNFPNQDMQVFDLAEDSGLVVTPDYWRNDTTNKGYAIRRLAAGPNDFYVPAPPP